MQEELRLLIEKNLPKHVGEVLQGRLKELEEKEIELKNTKQVLSAKELGLEKAKKIASNWEEKARELEALNNRKEALDERERNLNITILKHKLEESEKRGELAKEYLFSVFKNPTFKTVEQHHGSTPVTKQIKNNDGSMDNYVEVHPTSNVVEKRTVQED
jgi:hypothetical protein